MKFNLDRILYIIGVFFSTSYNFLTNFLPMTTKIDEHMHDTNNLRSMYIVFFKQILENQEESSNNIRIMYKVILGIIPSLALMSFIYFNVQMIIYKTKFKKRYQMNILTFNQNFYFYIIFVIAHVTITLIRIKVLTFAHDDQEAETILICSYILRLLISWLIRPIMIIFLLKKNIPDFFDDFDIPISEEVFKIRGQTIFPRQQKFLSYKPFCQDARWGSESKFQNHAVNVNQRIYTDRKRNVHMSSTVVIMPDVSF